MIQTSRIAVAGSFAIGLALMAGSAHADLTINPNGNAGGVQALPEPVLNGGPGFPLGIFGYIGGAQLVADVTGKYTFTFEGAGDSAATNSFTAGGNTFTAVGPGGTGAGSSPLGDSFTMALTAGQTIDFTFSSSTGCVAASGTVSGSVGCNYLIALANSPTAPGAFDVSQTSAWLGFSDRAAVNDADFQDMVVRVDEHAPEPASLVLLGAGLAGLGLFRRRKTT